MTAAELPDDEVERLAALRSYRLLDTEPEPALDSLVALAAELTDTPISLVSLIDAERQWFKARHGLDVAETHRDIAFCAHAIRGRTPLIVPDATVDPRFADNPLVIDGVVRSYAGIPLLSHSGHALGTLCVIDRRARQLEAETIERLRTLATQVQTLLYYRHRELDRLERATRRFARLNDFDLELHATFAGVVGAHELLANTDLTGDQDSFLQIGQHAADHLGYLLDHLALVLERPSRL